jgi:Lon protease-like protein
MHIIDIKKLPKNIPALYDTGIFLLPGEEVEFQIKGQYFRDSVDYSFKNSNRYISVYNDSKLTKNNSKIATIGRIIKFTEKSANNYLIVIKGIIRFNILGVLKTTNNVKILMPNFDDFENDLYTNGSFFKNRNDLNKVVNDFFDKSNNPIINNLNIDKISDIKLLSLLASQLKFNHYNKCKLINSKTSDEINNVVYNLLEYELALLESKTMQKH